jgi:glycosyltransferase involved in cell wall biosynthesis
MANTWRKIDCLVHTAVNEPFGRVIIEALAHKVCVIANDSCGPAEIIQDGKTGILLPSNNVESLSHSMLKIINDKALSERLKSAGYDHVITNFLAENTAANITEIYQEALHE